MRKIPVQLIICGMLFNASVSLAQSNQGAETKAVATEQECIPKIGWIPLCTKKAQGDALAENVLAEKTFSNKDDVNIPGTMVNNGAVTIDPDTADQAIPSGYHNGTGTVKGDPSLLPGNIKSGATIFGIAGAAIESSGTATSGQVLSGQTFSNASGPATGTMSNVGAQNISPGTADQAINEGYHDGTGAVKGDTNLLPANIKSGTTIFGISGMAIEASGTATPGQVLDGQTFSNASGPAAGSMPDNGAVMIIPGAAERSIPAGYHNGSGTVATDGNLLPGNIRSGVSIFGVTGDPNVVDSSTGDAVAGDILSGKKAWVDGSEVTGSIPIQTLSAATSTVAAGYYHSADLATVDPDLIAQKIACGTTIFGVIGTFTGVQNTVCSVGRVWMDRNLGASRVATSLADSEAYGDLYQWGRLADGHEKRASGTSSTLSTEDVPGHGSFITVSSPPYDWRTPQNNALWQGASGTNNPCPAGFRLPTIAELAAERASWTGGYFASPLKLVRSGHRERNDGAIYANWGYYWSSSFSGSNSAYLYLHYDGVGSNTSYSYRAQGNSVRCLKD